VTVDPLAVTWLIAWAVLAAVILLAGLLAQGARRRRSRRPGYLWRDDVVFPRFTTDERPVDWQADPDDWFDGWDDGEAA
jgi:hypothetical protein